MAKPCYTTPDSAGCATLQDRDCQCWGSRELPSFFFKGAILSRERMAPLCNARTPHFPSALRESSPPRERKKQPFRAATLLFTNDRLFGGQTPKGLGAFRPHFRAGASQAIRMSLQDTTPALISSSPREVDVGHLELVVVHLGLELLLFRVDLRADARGAGRSRASLRSSVIGRMSTSADAIADVAIQKALLAEDIEQARHADRNADAGGLRSV